MSTLRKIGLWLWLNKERMLLIVMLGILVWRVYMVINPEKIPDTQIKMPKPDPSNLPADKKPGEPDAEPEIPPPSDWSSLWIRNPFTVYSETSQQSGKDSEKSPSIYLLDIQKAPDGTPRVLLSYGNTKKWHKEGDPFVSYKLSSINVEERSCEVYSEKEGRYITVRAAK